MRYLLPVVAMTAALTVGVATPPPRPRTTITAAHHRAKTHLALHVSGHSVLAGNGVAVRGRVRPGGRRRVKLVFRGPDGAVVKTTSRANGRFAVRWKPRRIGSYRVRAYGAHNRHARGGSSKARRLTSFRYAGASYYGPGLYGNGVACGGTLTPGTLGVANKTLPCGTMVRLRYHGRSIRVPVIDRGPYVAGREYDLTEATRNRLGFPGVGNVLADH